MLESLSLEHGPSAVCGLVAEGAGFPAGDRIGLDKAAALFSYGVESGFQRGARYAVLAMVLKNSKAGDSPQPLGAGFRSMAAILVIVVDSRELLPGAILAPAYRLAPFGVDQDTVRASAVEESALFPPVPHSSLGPGTKLLVLG